MANPAPMFAPRRRGDAGPPVLPPEDWRTISPVPSVVLFKFPAHRLGKPSAFWKYKNEKGFTLGAVARFDAAEGKAIWPLTYGARPDGFREWRWKSLPEPRPLYGLDRLAQRPGARILVVEGEKKVEPAEKFFPDYVAVTSPGGARAAGKADWTPLKGRRVVVWPDADDPTQRDGKNPGEDYARDVCRLAHEAGAVSVVMVPVPEELRRFKDGWDLADAPPEGWTPERLRAELLEKAIPWEPPTEPEPAPRARVPATPAAYIMRDTGLWWQDLDPEKPDLPLAGRFDVVAETRDADGNAWGVLLRWRDHDGHEHEWAMPRAMLAGDGADARRALMDGGLYIAPGKKARELLNSYLASVRVEARVRAVARIGWHGRAFVLPDETIGDTTGEHVQLQMAGAFEHAFRVKGSLDEWQEHVARLCAGNSRLAFALSCAFAAPLLDVVDAESGGFHLRGPSSIGKSTALVVAGSACGGGGLKGYIRQWRATDNGLEAVAAAHCDCLLALDELSQIDAKAARAVAYMLANGAGKARAKRTGDGRAAAEWRALFLSSGEIGLADKVAEDGSGHRATAGQHVRVVDVPADAGAGLGLFEDLHGFPSADTFARALKGAAGAYYGTAARAFVRKIVEDPEHVREGIKGFKNEFVSEYCPAGADGQVTRVADRFGLVAAAGELATRWGVLPWKEGQASQGAAACFRAWLDGRGGVEPAEVTAGIAKVRRFVEAHGDSRFAPWGGKEGDRPTINRAGFRKPDGEGGVEYYVLPEAWRSEVCAGFDAGALARALAARGMLKTRNNGKLQFSARPPGFAKNVSCYVLTPSLFEGGDDAES